MSPNEVIWHKTLIKPRLYALKVRQISFDSSNVAQDVACSHTCNRNTYFYESCGILILKYNISFEIKVWQLNDFKEGSGTDVRKGKVTL